jgi:hypothetical protein
MKFLKQNLLLIFLLTFIVLVSSFPVKAENDWNNEKYNFRWMNIPVICGTTLEVQKYLTDNDFLLESMSVGKENAEEDGKIVYLVTYFLNKKRTQSITAITSPVGDETCMLYRSFDIRRPGIGT